VSSGGEPRVERLNGEHDLSRFCSGASPLDRWLTDEARTSEARDAARVYVIVGDAGYVVAYTALVVGTVSSADVPRNAGGGISYVPVVRLGKLAVDEHQQSRGLGTILLTHAIRSSLTVRELVAVRLLIVDALDEEAKAWYEKRGFNAVAGQYLLYARLNKLV
jgi:ribosomal protein S18 acetylase RimI-like enzyme